MMSAPSTWLNEFQFITRLYRIKIFFSILGFESGSLRNKRKQSDFATSTDTIANTETESQMRSLTRHLSQAKPTYDHSETGFLWSWNFMISKKWKITSNTGATGEIAFMDKMLADFRAFCRYLYMV